jgi:hypothetical protein
MKIGALHITWSTSDRDRQVRRIARNYMVGPDGREIVARMARSEVKNYLADLAELAELPFVSPQVFLKVVRAVLLEEDRAPDPADEEAERFAAPADWEGMGEPVPGPFMQLTRKDDNAASDMPPMQG